MIRLEFVLLSATVLEYAPIVTTYFIIPPFSASPQTIAFQIPLRQVLTQK